MTITWIQFSKTAFLTGILELNPNQTSLEFGVPFAASLFKGSLNESNLDQNHNFIPDSRMCEGMYQRKKGLRSSWASWRTMGKHLWQMVATVGHLHHSRRERQGHLLNLCCRNGSHLSHYKWAKKSHYLSYRNCKDTFNNPPTTLPTANQSFNVWPQKPDASKSWPLSLML